MSRREIVGPRRVAAGSWEPRIVSRGYAVATWDDRQAQWTCPAVHGYGYGRTPEAAVEAAAWDGGEAPLGYRTLRDARAEVQS